MSNINPYKTGNHDVDEVSMLMKEHPGNVIPSHWYSTILRNGNRSLNEIHCTYFLYRMWYFLGLLWYFLLGLPSFRYNI